MRRKLRVDFKKKINKDVTKEIKKDSGIGFEVPKKFVFFGAFLLVLLICGIFSFKSLSTNNNFSISSPTNTISIGDIINLEVNGTTDMGNIKYSSSNPDVASVDENGVIVGLSAGVSTIRAEYGKNVSLFVVTVNDMETSNVTVNANLKIVDGKINVTDTGTFVMIANNSSASVVKNNTVTLGKLIDIAMDYNAVLYFPKGRYYIGQIDLGANKTITFEGESPITNYTFNTNDTTHSIIIYSGSKGIKNPMLKQSAGIAILKNLAFWGAQSNSSVKYDINGSFFSVGGKGGGDKDTRPRIFAQNCEFSGWSSAIGGAYLSNNKLVYTKVYDQDAYNHVALLTDNCYFSRNGVALSQLSDSRINKNIFSNNYYDVALGNGVGGVSIFESKFNNAINNSIYIGASLDIYDIKEGKFLKNYVNSNGNGPHDVTIESNIFSNQSKTPIYITTTRNGSVGRINANGVLILKNTFNGSISYSIPSVRTKELDSLKTRIYVGGCTSCIVGDNKENSTTVMSMYLRNSSKVTLANNFTGSKYYYLKCKGTNTMSDMLTDGKKQGLAWEYSNQCTNFGS